MGPLKIYLIGMQVGEAKTACLLGKPRSQAEQAERINI